MAAACTFCRVIVGQLPSALVMADEAVVAFLDHRPLFPGHVLVMPREHVETLMDLPPGDLEPLFGAVQRVSRAVEEALEADGIFVAVNNRVSQSVPHLHVHVVPRRKKDGLRGFFWPRAPYAGDDEMAATAGRIRAALRP